MKLICDETMTRCRPFDDGTKDEVVWVFPTNSVPTDEALKAIIQGGLPIGVLLEFPELRLRDIAATVYAEASPGDLEEAEGIAWVIRNRAKHRNVDIKSESLFAAKSAGGIGGKSDYNGRGEPKHTNAFSKRVDTWVDSDRIKMHAALEGTVKALISTKDITKNAYFWVSSQMLFDSTTETNQETNKSEVKRKVNLTTFEALSNGKWSTGGNDPFFKDAEWNTDKTYAPMFVVTVIIGKSAFLKYNPSGPKGSSIWP